MRARVLLVASILVVFFSVSPICVGAITETVPDALNDGVDYFVYLNEHQVVPAPLDMDIISVGVNIEDTIVDFTLEFNEAVPTEAPYSIQIAIESDKDQSTGIATPEWYYNGIGADYMVELDSNGLEFLSTVSGYTDGVWEEKGTPTIVVAENTITISFDPAMIGDPDAAGIMFYVIQGISLDMAPEEGTPPLSYVKIPYIELGEPDIVYVITFNYPEQVLEGTPVPLDAPDFTTDPSLEPYVFEWDLDGDGVFDVTQNTAAIMHTFSQDGAYSVTLKVTDVSGISGEVTQTVNVENISPYDVEFNVPSGLEAGGTILLSGSALDLGDDQLTYVWNIDGEIYEGQQITVTIDTAGEKTITLTVTDDAGASTQRSHIVTVNQPEEPETEPKIDPLLIILVVAFGIGGFFIYNKIKPKKEEKQPPKKEPEKPKGFCEEHPEVVEQEEKACWDAQWSLDNAIGDIQDRLDVQRDVWRADIKEASRTIMEWDISYAMIQSLTKSEAEIKKESETVQKVASIVKPGGSISKTVFKEGEEAAMKELGKHVASEVGKSVAGELSSTVNDVLSLEGWAYSEIGIGLAKLITGIDPKKEASELRKDSTRIANDLQSWVDKDMAKTRRYTHRTLHTCIDEAQQMLDDVSKAMDDFEQAISGFRCVDCDMPDNILEEIDALIKELDGFIKTFGDLIDQIQQRLDQAVAMYKRKDVYDSPMTWLHAQNNEVPNIQTSLRKSDDAKKG